MGAKRGRGECQIKKDEYVYTDKEGNSFGALSSMIFKKLLNSDGSFIWIGLTDNLSAILEIIEAATLVEIESILSNFSFDMVLRMQNSDRYVSMASVSMINNPDSLKVLIMNSFSKSEAMTLKEAIAKPFYNEPQRDGKYPLSFKEFKHDILPSDSFHLVRLINLAQEITDKLCREGTLKLAVKSSSGDSLYKIA